MLSGADFSRSLHFNNYISVLQNVYNMQTYMKYPKHTVAYNLILILNMNFHENP